MKNLLDYFIRGNVYIDGSINVVEKHRVSDVLCLTHLVGKHLIDRSASIDESEQWYNEQERGCLSCSAHYDCPVFVVVNG